MSSCGIKVYEKLWNNYLAKYGDFRERLQLIRNDQQCFMPLQLPRIRQPSLNVRGQSSISVKTSVVDGSNQKLDEKCRSSVINDNLSFALNQTDRNELEKIIHAEDFPNNIFPVDTRSLIDDKTELPIKNNVLDRLSSTRLTSPLTSLFSKPNVSHSMTQHDEGSSMYPRSKRQRSIHKSEFVLSSHDPTTIRITNPYKQLLEHLRRAEKTKSTNSDIRIDHKSLDSIIDTNTHTRIQNLLSFLNTLDDTTDSTTIDENTLISFFCVDNHLSSSIFVPTNIRQINNVPKPILHSLKNTSDNERILDKILAEGTLNKSKNIGPLVNITKEQPYSNDNSQSSNFVDQDKELNSRLSNTYAIKSFKEFLIHHNKSTRLPKLYHDIDPQHQN